MGGSTSRDRIIKIIMKKAPIIIIILAIIVSGFFLFRGDGVPGERALAKAPEFSLEDYDGNIVTSGDFAGRPTIVNVWATWCPFCQLELVDFAEVQKIFRDDLTIISIDRGESVETAKTYSDRLGVTDDFVFLVDPDDKYYRDIGGFSMPETLFVDADGNIVFHKRGPLTKEDIVEKIDELFNIQPKE